MLVFYQSSSLTCTVHCPITYNINYQRDAQVLQEVQNKVLGYESPLLFGESLCDENKHQNAVLVKSVKPQGCSKDYLLTLALWFLTIQLRSPDKALGSVVLTEKLFTCYCYRKHKYFLHLNDLIFHESSHTRFEKQQKQKPI